jgi:hypothetical protein
MLAAGVSGVQLTDVSVGGTTVALSARAENWVSTAQVEPNGRMAVFVASGPLDVTATETYASGAWKLTTFAERPPASYAP